MTVENSPLIAAVSGGNGTVSGGVDVVLDITAFDPDEVQLKHTTRIAPERAISVCNSNVNGHTFHDYSSSIQFFVVRRTSNTSVLCTDTLRMR